MAQNSDRDTRQAVYVSPSSTKDVVQAASNPLHGIPQRTLYSPHYGTKILVLGITVVILILTQRNLDLVRPSNDQAVLELRTTVGQFDQLRLPHIPVDISSLFNNIAAGTDADFDPHSHGSYAAEHLPEGAFIYDGVQFRLPETWNNSQPDNLIPHGEKIDIGSNAEFIREMHILYAGDWIDGESGARFTFHFEDGSTEEVEVSVKNWWTLHWLNQGVIRTPYHYTPSGKNFNLTQIYHWSTAVRSTSQLASVTLPTATWPNHLHIFSMTLIRCITPPPYSDTTPLVQQHSDQGLILAPSLPVLSFRRIKYTTKWTKIQGVKCYLVEATIANPFPSFFAVDQETWARDRYFVSIRGKGIETVQAGILQRLMPSDEVKVKVWVVRTLGSEDKTNATAIITREDGVVVGQLRTNVLSGVYLMNTNERDSPEWWDDAKFGIFVHWGLFSVPAWAPDGWYAEWYNWWLHKWPNANNGFWKHHLDTYGPKVVYDDFIANFTAANFNASEWVQLFDDAGAKYFVIVTKHHDGFALFNTKDTTHRSSWHLGPKRDFVRELFDASKLLKPDMKRGTYITMPEWYNPDAGKGGYGFGDWPGHLARNAFDDSLVEPYTGHLKGKDYLRDIQLEHMRMLALNYETDIIWCDIGGPNLTKEFAQEWFPFAESQGRQVIMNNRCGDLPQFDTPEYARFSSIQRTKWETSEGIDPYSYGYNHRRKDDEYRSVKTIIHSLVDIVSKNGNYLLNVGPNAEGVIIKPMVDRLLEVGKWLAHSRDCIYATDYFFLHAEYGSLRFTQTQDTFCIISLDRPQNGQLIVQTQVPVLPGDKISLLGGGEWGRDLKWKIGDGQLEVDVPDAALDNVDWAWAFKVEYSARNRTLR